MPGDPTYSPKVDDVLRYWESMKRERMVWYPTWRDAVDYVVPWRGRYLRAAMQALNPSQRSPIVDDSAIVNGIASRSVSTGASGIQSSLTSPARPWFRLTTSDPGLSEIGVVRAYLFRIERLVQWVFARSNIHNELHISYRDQLSLGTAPLYVDEDDNDVIRAYVLPVGQYALLNSARQRVDACGREFFFTVRQLLERFAPDGNLDRISATTRKLADQKQWNQQIPVLHLVVPNADFQPGAIGARGKRWLACWRELVAARNEPFLEVGGYRQFPVMAGRWEVTGTEEVYGHSAVEEVMPDIKQLQHMDTRKIELVDKSLTPPTQGPPGTDYPSLLAGAFNFLPANAQGAEVKVIHAPDRGAIQEARISVNELVQRIREGLHEDLWRMLIDRGQEDQASQGGRVPGMTAFEVASRHEEKLILLGPFVERIHNEVLSPLIKRTIAVLADRGDLPPPPREFAQALAAGEDVRIEYLSVLAQAQRLLGLGSLERFASIVTALAGGDPNSPVWDKLDRDELADQAADMLGIPPNVVRSDEDVAAMRLSRARQMKAAQDAQNAQALASAAANNARAAPQGAPAFPPQGALDRLLAGYGPVAQGGVPPELPS